VHTGINIGSFKILPEEKGNYKAQPFAYLLKLVDELQDWDRQNFVRKENGGSVLHGKSMDIFASTKNIWVWYEEDNKYREPEQEGSRFSRLISSLSNIELDGLLRAIKYTKRPNKDTINEYREEFHDVFFSKLAEEFIEHIKYEQHCNVRGLLYNRENGTFGFLHKNGVISLITDKKIHRIAKEHYFKNDSIFYTAGSDKNVTGFALIRE